MSILFYIHPWKKRGISVLVLSLLQKFGNLKQGQGTVFLVLIMWAGLIFNIYKDKMYKFHMIRACEILLLEILCEMNLQLNLMNSN